MNELKQYKWKHDADEITDVILLYYYDSKNMYNYYTQDSADKPN